MERLHLDLMDGPIRRPFSLCQDQGSSFDWYGFKVHVCYHHGIYLRPDRDGFSIVPTEHKTGPQDSISSPRPELGVGERGIRTPRILLVNPRVVTEDNTISSPRLKISEQGIRTPSTPKIVLKRSGENLEVPAKRRRVVA